MQIYLATLNNINFKVKEYQRMKKTGNDKIINKGWGYMFRCACFRFKCICLRLE